MPENYEEVLVTNEDAAEDYMEVVEQLEKIELNNDSLTILGNNEQRRAMFSAMSMYIGEVTNPDNTATNPFLKNKYAPLSEVLNTTRPVLAKYGLAFTQWSGFGSGAIFTRTLLTHKDGAMMAVPELKLPLAKSDAQSIMAGLTYARRAQLNPLLGVYGEEDDDGNSATGAKEKKSAPEQPVDPKLKDARQKVIDLCAEKIKTVDKKVIYTIIADVCGNQNPNKLKTVADCSKVIDAINKLN